MDCWRPFQSDLKCVARRLSRHQGRILRYLHTHKKRESHFYGRGSALPAPRESDRYVVAVGRGHTQAVPNARNGAERSGFCIMFRKRKVHGTAPVPFTPRVSCTFDLAATQKPPFGRKIGVDVASDLFFGLVSKNEAKKAWPRIAHSSSRRGRERERERAEEQHGK